VWCRALHGSSLWLRRMLCVVQSSARFILVVEKDAIFQRLSEDRLWSLLPCILITARGMPDMATRAFLHKLHTQV
jgi:DNA topoisomerase VI subunit A